MGERPLFVPVVPDPDWPATWNGGHALVIEFGDEEFIVQCQCGHPLGTCHPSDSLDRFQLPWERHLMTQPVTTDGAGGTSGA
jgi:hypothetical protein